MKSDLQLNRRSLLRGGAGAAGMALLSGGTTLSVFQALASRGARAAAIDYGPLLPAIDEASGLPLLKLPEGFRYISYGWTRDPMRDGTPTPSLHDGMAVVKATGPNLVLVRNHEQGSNANSFAKPQLTFDSRANGGTTNLMFNTQAGKFITSWPSLSGTIRNCAGGPTPWGSWITCEETTQSRGSTATGFQEHHGWLFDVPANGNTDPTPAKAAGRFSHEAIAVDPLTGYIYETEDANPSGFYRFVTNEYGKIGAGGTLQMMKVKNATVATDLRGKGSAAGGFAIGEIYDVEWVTIDDPETINGVSCVNQGIAKFGARFTRLEGIWYDNGSMFFTATDGGAANQGQIWQYTPAEETLKLIYVSPNQTALNAPDNITVHPKRGIVLCEDGGRSPQMLHFLSLDGQIRQFAHNNIDLRQTPYKGFSGNYVGNEWCGACFSPDGEWLFVNIQTPGVTFAITGPWIDYVANPV